MNHKTWYAVFAFSLGMVVFAAIILLIISIGFGIAAMTGWVMNAYSAACLLSASIILLVGSSLFAMTIIYGILRGYVRVRG